MARKKRDEDDDDIGERQWDIRRLGPADLQVLTRLALDNGRFGAPGERLELAPLPTDDGMEFLEDDRTVCLVAFERDDPIGFLYACELYRRHSNLRHLCLYEIGVADTHRHRGVGSQLLEALQVHARARGIDRGFAVTNESNREAIDTYKRHGGVRPSNDDVLILFEF